MWQSSIFNICFLDQTITFHCGVQYKMLLFLLELIRVFKAKNMHSRIWILVWLQLPANKSLKFNCTNQPKQYDLLPGVLICVQQNSSLL